MPDISQWALLWGAVLPLVVGLVTTRVTSSGAKAVILLALNAVAGLLDQFFLTPEGFDWKGVGITVLASFIVGVATHFGLWKPLGASEALQDVGSGKHAAPDN